MVTLSDARQQFIGHLKGRARSTSTILAYGKDVEQLVTFLESQSVIDPKETTVDQLITFMGNLLKDGYTPKSISRKTNSTKTFFKFLQSSNLIASDPAVSLEHPDFENKPPRILSKLEYRALRDAARGDIRMSAVIELLLQSGMRIGELSKVNVEAVRRYLEIRPKTQNHTLFVTKTGRPLLVRNIRTSIDRYFRLAGIKGTKVNDLRHTWITHQLGSGLSLVMVSKLAGHKRVAATERYLQYVSTRSSEDKIKLEE